MNNKPPHLVQYQGSKRNLAKEILKFISTPPTRLLEPFAGTAAISIAASFYGLASSLVINDINPCLSKLLELAIQEPEYVAEEYQSIWEKQEGNSVDHYFEVRNTFNLTQDPVAFLYLLARCVKGAVRYNSSGQFNQSPDKRRRGTNPKTMKNNIHAISYWMKGKCTFWASDYKAILDEAKSGDLVYLDPPYQGVCSKRDSRYLGGVNFEEFVGELDKLNSKNINFIVSYDGKCGSKQYGNYLPRDLNLEHILLDAGRSAQATLLGKSEKTYESMYISQGLRTITQNSQNTLSRLRFSSV
jgi:DNA adenine methylase